MNYMIAIVCGILVLLVLLALMLLRKRKPVVDGGILPADQGGSTIRTHYFENFIQSYNGKAEDTRRDVESIWARMTTLLDPNRPAQGMSEEDATGCVEVVPTLMNNPDGCGRVSGLVVGRVQSGKTRNYVGLLLKAFDEGWNTVIVMTSNNKMLARQTWNRLLGTGRNEGDVYNRGKASVTKMSMFKRDESGNVEFTWCLDDGEWHEGELYIGVVQKEDDHLKELERWLKSIETQKQKRMRVLIIDDEADNATPDSSVGSRDVDIDDAEVLGMASMLRPSAITVSEWIKSLVEKDLTDAQSQKVIKSFLGNHPNPYKNIGNFKRAVLENHEICELLGVHKRVQDGGCTKELREVLAAFFNGRKTKSNQIQNSKTFVALVLYALEFAPKRSTINRYLCGIASRESGQIDFAYPFKQLAYIGYTATPFANMLNEDPLKNPLAPDFVKPLAISNAYFGLDRIHGSDVNRRVNVVREIPQEDESGAVQPIVDYNWSDLDDNGGVRQKPEVSEELVVTSDAAKSGHEWKSMKDSIVWLYCAAAARRLFRERMSDEFAAERGNRWTTMIINISHEISVHSQLRGFIERYVEYISLGRGHDGFLEACKSLWEREAKALSLEKFRSSCGESFSDLANAFAGWYPSWDDISTGVKWFLANKSNSHVIEINSTERGKDWQTEYMTGCSCGMKLADDHVWIICGGNTISRGLTLDGLVSSYFDRIGAGSCVDTITQMGRWFGYRTGYELLPRIWMTKVADEEMADIAAIECALHQELGRKFERGTSPKNSEEFACVRFLGRRLTGRDAAIEVIGRSGFSDYFGNVLTDGSGEMESSVQKWLCEHKNSRFVVQDDDRAKYSWQIKGRRPCPYYKNIDGENVSNLLEELKMYFNQTDRLAMENLIRVGRENPSDWDVAIENPGKLKDGREFNARIGVAYSMLHTDPVQGVLQLKTQSYAAWVADIENVRIKEAECNLAEAFVGNRKGGDWDAVRKEIVSVRADDNPEARLSLATRTLVGISKGSSEAYRAATYEAAGKVNPVLHLTLANVGSESGRTYKVVLVSYYWPRHHVDAVARPKSCRMDLRYEASFTEICDCIRSLIKQVPLITVDLIREKLGAVVGSADPSDELILRGVELCADCCAVLDLPDDEKLLKRRKIVYSTLEFRPPDMIGSVRKYVGDVLRDHFSQELAQNGFLSATQMYEYLKDLLMGGIAENQSYREFQRSPWFGVLNKCGIKSIQD